MSPLLTVSKGSRDVCVSAIAEKALGPEHPDAAMSLENYATLLREMNRQVEAEQLDARAKVIRSKRAQEKSDEARVGPKRLHSRLRSVAQTVPNPSLTSPRGPPFTGRASGRLQQS